MSINMLKKFFFSVVALSLPYAYGTDGDDPIDTTKPQAYDADLFNKGKEVYFVNAEFLYWIVNEGALDYALRMEHPTSGGMNLFANGELERAKYDWAPGFRVNVGWFYAPHYWDAYLQYTYLRSHGSDEVHAPGGSGKFLNGTFPQPDPSPITGASLVKAHTHLDFHYNLADFLFSRRFHPNPHLRMVFFGGVEGAWLRQFWKVNYLDTLGHTSEIHNNWRFTGAGLRTGLSFDWYLRIADLFLTATGSAAILAGKYHNHAKETSTLAGTLANAHYEDTRLTGTMQLLVGPSWQKCWSSIRTVLYAGYELNVWSNLQEVLRSTSGTPQAAKETWLGTGTVSLQGISVRFNVDF